MTDASNADERIAKRAAVDDARSDRTASSRNVAEDRESSDAIRQAERLAILRDVNTKLPTPPEIPGYHLCWLTTTNQADPLEWRYRMGYELVKPSELPGFMLSSQQSGQAAISDRIQINEMVLAKIPHETWVENMTHLHHDLPQEMAQNLSNSVRIESDGRGRRMAYTGGEFNRGISDGFAVNKSRPPSFVGVG